MSVIEERRVKAISDVDYWLQGLNLVVERIGQSALARLGFEGFSDGWSMPLPIEGGGSMFLLLDNRFPYSIPRVAVSERDDILLWPHVERNGLLCIAGDNANIATSQPVEVIRSTLYEAENLLHQNERGELVEDYLIDFQAYWGREVAGSESTIYSMTDHIGGSRIVSAWHGMNAYWVGETPKDILNWFKNKNGEEPEGEPRQAGLVKLNRLPEPQEYPKTVPQLRDMFAKFAHDGVAVLDQLLQQESQRVIMLLEGLTTAGQKASAGLIIQRAENPLNKLNRIREPLSKGFRPGHVPGKVIATRYCLRRTIVTAVDSSRSRIDQTIVSALNSKKVAIIGCGSVGSSVARMLIQSGVNSMVLIDPELLGWENLGRHELGAQDVGSPKVKALERHLRRRFPHVDNIRAVGTDLLSAIAKDSELFEDCDLIVSATAAWNAESALNDMQIQGEIRCPIIYSWLEDKAVAAHVLVVFDDGHGCFGCGFGPTGKPRMAVTRWPEDKMDIECGGGISVYGSAELANNHSLTASLSIDVLTGGVKETKRRAWISGKSSLVRYGGSWNPDWCDAYGEPEKFGRTIETQWEASAECASCRERRG